MADTMNIAPWAMPISWDGSRDLGLRWEERRTITKVVLVLRDGAAEARAEHFGVRYWRQHWPDDRPREVDTGALGWAVNDDWYNGEWQPADTAVNASPGRVEITFRLLGESEFPKLRDDYNVAFRSTMQLRVVVGDGAPEVERVEAYSASQWREGEVRLEWGHGWPAPRGTVRVEAYNGSVLAVVPATPTSAVRIGDGMAFEPGASPTDGVRIRTQYAAPTPDTVADHTIIRLRGEGFAFSFRPDEVLEGEPILVRDRGVFVTKAADGESYDACHARAAKSPGSVYDRVTHHEEQTLQGAVEAMPPPKPLYFVLGCEGARQKFRVDPDGSIALPRNYIERVPGRDTGRMAWSGELALRFHGLPEGLPLRHLREGYLPVLSSRWEAGGLEITEDAVATPLLQSIRGPAVAGDAPILCMVRFRVTNRSSEARRFALSVRVSDEAGPQKLSVNGPLARAESDGGPRLRFAFSCEGGAAQEEEGSLAYAVALDPGAATTLVLAIPFLTLTEPAELECLLAKKWETEVEEVAGYWRDRVAEGCHITTPEANLNLFHRAHLTHMLITDDREPGSDRIHTRVGSFNYGDFSNESTMIISDLDRRGYHDQARRRLESYLHFQSTVGLPGNYSSQEGIFYGSGGYECGGYNQHHGWVLWCMGEHYRYTRDSAWFEQAAPRILAGCDWVIGERQATKKMDASGQPVLEYGFLPAGSLEDVTDYHFWLSTNAFTYRGVKSCADAFAQAEHPEAERLLREAEAYRADLERGFREQMARAPVVRLRDGTSVSVFPSRLYLRGRDHGWIRETLEGAIHLIGCEVIDPRGREAEWVLRDYEDNRYISDRYGYQIEDYERYWFGRGGFSMQPNLLWGPVAYALRDEVPQFIRAYFNSFASAYRPDLQMLTEHPLPGLGDCTGDHFKTSDESQSTNWLRMMFLREEGHDLYVAQAIPRAWFATGRTVGIERAATWFGPAGWAMDSQADRGRISLLVHPPKRNPPRRMFVRIRHPEGKAATRFVVNGVPAAGWDPKREWVVLEAPYAEELQVTAEY